MAVGEFALKSQKAIGEYGVNFGVNFDFLKQKRHPRVNSWMSVNVDIIVLINVLRQLTLSGCSHICKRLNSQQLCQLHQFSKEI